MRWRAIWAKLGSSGRKLAAVGTRKQSTTFKCSTRCNLEVTHRLFSRKSSWRIRVRLGHLARFPSASSSDISRVQAEDTDTVKRYLGSSRLCQPSRSAQVFHCHHGTKPDIRWKSRSAQFLVFGEILTQISASFWLFGNARSARRSTV